MVSRQTTVLVVDDDRRFCRLLGSILQDAGMEVILAHSAEEALVAARGRRPDAAILEVVLPRLGGYALLRELRGEHGDDLPVIFVSGERVDPLDRATGILLGGDDYLVKPIYPEELLARLGRLLPATRAHGTWPELTNREVEVLQLVAEGRPPAEIAHRLSISPKTVSSHMQRIFTKLEVHTRAQAVAVAYEAGLVRVTPSSVGHDVSAHALNAA